MVTAIVSLMTSLEPTPGVPSLSSALSGLFQFEPAAKVGPADRQGMSSYSNHSSCGLCVDHRAQYKLPPAFPPVLQSRMATCRLHFFYNISGPICGHVVRSIHTLTCWQRALYPIFTTSCGAVTQINSLSLNTAGTVLVRHVDAYL